MLRHVKLSLTNSPVFALKFLINLKKKNGDSDKPATLFHNIASYIFLQDYKLINIILIVPISNLFCLIYCLFIDFVSY